MKKIIYIVVIACLFFMSCEDVLDKMPLNQIGESNVWEDKNLAELFIADLYNRARFFADPRNCSRGVAEACSGGLCRSYGAWQVGYNNTIKVLSADHNDDIAPFHFWAYGIVREINEAIERLSDESSPLDEDYRNTRLGECYFLRGWIYFRMVRVYGGVPIIDRVQAIDEPDDELYVPRSSEEETYDFVAADCDRARTLLAGKNLTEYGRVTEWAALALKSRAMLYAGSIGEFGQVQTIGSGNLETTLGISNPDKYWNLSLEASKEIIDNGPFSLYEKNQNLAQNFEDLFQSEGADNPEVIFSERFSGKGSRGHDWDLWLQPNEFRNGYGDILKGFKHSLEYFEFQDGTSGAMDPADYVKGDPNNLHSLQDFWLNHDLQARATFYFAETPWKGSIVYTHVGTYKLDASNVRQYISAGEVTDGTRTVPAKAPIREVSRSALNVKKRMTEDLEMTEKNAGLGVSDFIVFRLAEIYLNYAEADFNLNGTSVAGLTYLNLIRQRVGMPNKLALSQDVIRNERTVELMFEHHHFWDIRRWRIAEAELNGKTFYGIEMKYDFDEDKYEIYFINQGGNDGDMSPRFFLSHNYYYPISTDRLNANPSLVQNPGYVQ